MRLILSRKGFDSASGGCPSPVFPDGSMLSLPIPDRSSTLRYEQLSWRGRNLGDLVSTLTRGKQRATFFAHLDPDIHPDLTKRSAGWRPMLGQEGISQSHLRKQGVGVGDLFLFWGLFQRVDGRLQRLGAPFHALWGWLQVGQVADVSVDVLPALAERWAWAASHPHVGIRDAQRPRKEPNCLYVAADRLTLPGTSTSRFAGAGIFPRFRPELQLTSRPGGPPSRWRLPVSFAPGDRTPLTYHSSPDRWSHGDGHVILQTVGRGQEFVLDLDEYPDVVAWVSSLYEGEVLRD